MGKLFISFSSKNRQLAESFTELLQLGMGVRREDIFCTAFSDNLKTGEDFIRQIREELKECEGVISLITEDYLRSKFCMIEAGAAWALSKRYFPLVMVDYEELKGTPLYGMQMRRLYQEEDMSTVYDELYDCKAGLRRQTAEFNRRLKTYMKRVKELQEHRNWIPKDEEGYYEATIGTVRKVKEPYRCYGIRGRVSDPPDGNEAASDWIFFRGGMYPELQPGDRIRFRIHKSEVRIFSDLGAARNLYPAELVKLDE